MSPTRKLVGQPFKLKASFGDPVRRALFAMLASPLEHTLGLAELNRRYAKVMQDNDQRNFLERTLSILDIRYHVAPEDWERIPKTGPLIVVSNHPFGGVDGVILAAILRRVRPDIKVLANYLLSRIPDLREYMLFVDVFGGPNAVRRNIRNIRAAIDGVQQGGLLTLFPSGEVSHIDLHKWAVLDPPWSETVARIVRKTQAPVLPVFFSGSNSTLFNILGLIHPLLRTAMLPREFLNKKAKTITVQIGSVIPYKRLESFPGDADLVAYLRMRTYLLQSREKHDAPVILPKAAPAPDPIAAPRDPALLLREVEALAPEHLLVTHGESRVFFARAHQIPHLIHEMGRLREITFRGVSEGTGRALDLDRFDDYYLHLFLWNTKKNDLVGAYRLGPTDEILPAHGVAGMYTATLFQYPQAVLERLGPALELGRSFVRPEYQKSYSPLMLLWKGIGAFCARYPRYQVLFGPVSINNKYQSISRQLIMSFLEATSSLPTLAGLFKAKNPPHVRPPKTVDLKSCSTVVRDIDEVSDLITEIESDQKGIPVLLKQYMKLGAKILGFNIDPGFGNVLDGLMLVDLAKTDTRIVERFAGVEGARKIQTYKTQPPAPTA